MNARRDYDDAKRQQALALANFRDTCQEIQGLIILRADQQRVCQLRSAELDLAYRRLVREEGIPQGCALVERPLPDPTPDEIAARFYDAPRDSDADRVGCLGTALMLPLWRAMWNALPRWGAAALLVMIFALVFAGFIESGVGIQRETRAVDRMER